MQKYANYRELIVDVLTSGDWDKLPLDSIAEKIEEFLDDGEEGDKTWHWFIEGSQDVITCERKDYEVGLAYEIYLNGETLDGFSEVDNAEESFDSEFFKKMVKQKIV